MFKKQCNYYDENGRCKDKATQPILFTITDKFSVRTRFCKKHFEQENHIVFGDLPFCSSSTTQSALRDVERKKTLNFLWVKRFTFCLICPQCNEPSGCYSIDELFINQKNGEECGNCGAKIPIVEANIQYAEGK